jgi:hypothetical protein
MCQWGNTKKVRVKVPDDLSYNGQQRWAIKGIDSCIAPIVEALQRAGIDMRSSCCGHEKGEGGIQLQDGRMLLILSKEQAQERDAIAVK